MKEMVSSFFENLYCAEEDPRPVHLLELVEPKVSEAMNEMLCRAFSAHEISDALFQMGPLKARFRHDFFRDTGRFSGRML